METRTPQPVVHLELHTGNLAAARSFYAQLCGWSAERIHASAGSYLALELSKGDIGGGIVECPTGRPLWLPYVEVSHIGAVTQRARELGAAVLLEPREGPAGWRSVVAAPASGELALWQPKPSPGRP
jgi:predicted enzyme related to lactoylglutathione lyase